MSAKALILIWTLVTCVPASALVVYVDKDATGANNGTSWVNAFNTIQPAIDAAAAGGGGEVWVAEGIYGEARSSDPHGIGTNTGSLELRSGVGLYGGFVGNETSVTSRGERFDSTIIDGSTSRGGQAAFHVVAGSNAATLDGFLIQGGNATLAPNTYNDPRNKGGGLFCEGISSLEVRNCSFVSNSAVYGGGVANLSSSPVFTLCRLEDNGATEHGGGVYNQFSSSPHFVRCALTHNSTAHYGGGMYSEANCTPSISQCVIKRNRSNDGGGLCNNASSTVSCVNSIFSENNAIFGGAIALKETCIAQITNCTFSANVANSAGSTLTNTYESAAPGTSFFTNCIIWETSLPTINGSGSTVIYSNVSGGFVGTGNISADPQFVNATIGDFHLSSGSPCIDSGTSSGAPISDMNGDPRPQGSSHDMGAYEGDGTFDWVEMTGAAQWPARGGHTTAVMDNKLWVLGGWGDVGDRRNDVWWSNDGKTWTQATGSAAWIRRYAHTTEVFQNKLWVLGGDIPGVYKNDVWWSMDGIAWMQATPDAGWPPREHLKSAVFKERLWILGGSNASTKYNDVWSSENGVAWTEMTPNAEWAPRGAHGTAVFDNKLWILGGANVSTRFNDVWSSEDGVTWTQATPNAPWAPRAGHATVVFDSKLWVMGGHDATQDLNDMWYSSDGATWIRATPHTQWTARGLTSVAVYSDRMWLLGGDNSTGHLNDVWSSFGTVFGMKGYEYTYDQVYRLTTVTPNNGVHITYDYDPAGNRLQKRVYSDLEVTAGSANPASGGVANNAADLPMLQLSLACNAGDTVTLQSLPLATSGSGNESTAISGAKLWFDTNGNGTVDGGDTQLGSTATITPDNGTLVFSGLNTTLTTGAPVYLLVTYTLNGTAGQGQTFSVTLPSASGVKAVFTDSFLPLTPLGKSVSGATATISTDTVAPAFAGLVSAVGGSRTASLSWDAATDPSTPITYSIWMSTASFAGVVSGDPAFQATGTAFAVPDLTNGQEYFFVVRAQDASGNRELNTVELSAQPLAVLHGLTLTAGPNGSVSDMDNMPYEEGAEVSVSAYANTGYYFSGWTGDVPAGKENINPLTLTMDGDRTLTANFTRSTGTVVVNVNTPVAPWSFLDGDNVPHTGTGAATLTGIPTGDIALAWGNLPGFLAPANPPAQTLAAGGAAQFVGAYAGVVTFGPPLPSLKLYAGDSLSLQAAASGGLGALHYAWKFDDGVTGPAAVGSDSSILSIPSVQTAQTGAYLCEVTDSTLTVYPSNASTVLVKDHLAITKDPVGGAFVAGDSVTLLVETTGGYPALSYQWKKNDENISGATTATLSFSPLKITDAGRYSVEVADTNGDSFESAAAELTVETGVPTVEIVGLWGLMAVLAAGGVLVRRRSK